jgi:RNA polymerase sigma-70 factor (ECF subfamily)
MPMVVARIEGQRGSLRALPGGRATAGPPPFTDEQLIEAFENGDRAVAGHLYGQLLAVVESTIVRILGSRGPDHDDLVQSAFEQIMITLAKRKFARACSLSSWASAVTTRVGLNALRSRVRERRVIDRSHEVPADVPSQGALDPERQADAKRELERLRGHLAAMKPEKAETVLLHDMLGYEMSEIAVLTGASLPAVQSRLLRGRRELNEMLEGASGSGVAGGSR